MDTHRRSISPIGSLMFAALGLLAGGAAAQPAPDAPPSAPPPPGQVDPPRPPRPDRAGPGRGERPRGDEQPAVSVSGTLQDFNLSPRGEAEGMILSGEGSRVVQINFPPPAAAAVTQGLKAGDSVSATAVPRLSMPDHPVYDLVSLKVGDGEIKVPRPGDAKEAKVEGTVKRLNYGRDGRVNGAVLESGEFVHVGPEAAEEVKLAVGQKVTVEGMQIPSISGGKGTVEAKTVNGVAARPEPREGRMDRRGPGAGGPPEGEGPRERRPGRGPGGPEGGPDGAPRPPAPPPPQR